MKLAFALVAASLVASAQDAVLSPEDALKLCTQMSQLMDSTAASIADLKVAAAPLLAGTKNTLSSLQKQRTNAPLTGQFVRQTRAFLAIADATPKPYPFDPAVQQQFADLRSDFARLEAHFTALIAAKEAQLRAPDPDNVRRYADENARMSAPGVNPRVVFMGDSITDFWHLNEYFTGRDFVNRGISGQITSQMLARMKTDVIDLHPRAVLILAGTNDIARGTPIDIIENNLILMAELAREHQIKVLIASVLPVSESQTERPIHTIQQLNSWIEQYCKQTGETYVDYSAKLRGPGGYLQTDLADDGLHPNSQGYRLMAPVAISAIDGALGRSTTPVETERRRRVHVF